MIPQKPDVETLKKVLIDLQSKYSALYNLKYSGAEIMKDRTRIYLDICPYPANIKVSGTLGEALHSVKGVQREKEELYRQDVNKTKEINETPTN